MSCRASRGRSLFGLINNGKSEMESSPWVAASSGVYGIVLRRDSIIRSPVFIFYEKALLLLTPRRIGCLAILELYPVVGANEMRIGSVPYISRSRYCSPRMHTRMDGHRGCVEGCVLGL